MGNQDAKPLLPENANENTNHIAEDVIDNDFDDDDESDDDDDDEIDEDDKDTRLIGNARDNIAYDKDFQLLAKERKQEEEDKKEEARNQRGEWEPGMQFPALDGMYPVIRVISNLSTTSLREV